MNCHGAAIRHYLAGIPEVANRYDIKSDVNYENLDNPVMLSRIADADVLIMNNIKNYPLLSPDNLVKHIKPECKVIKIEYFRFDGFWPLQKCFTNDFFYMFDESYSANTYTEYISHPMDARLIRDHFQRSLEKLKSLDQESDIKIYDFFMQNYKRIELFRDYRHPSAFLFAYMVSEILKLIGLPAGSMNLIYRMPFGIDVRYNLINDNVKRVLGLEYENTKIYYLNGVFTPEQFFLFTRGYFKRDMSTIDWQTVQKDGFAFLQHEADQAENSYRPVATRLIAGEHDEAEAAIRNILLKEPRHVRALNDLGVICWLRGEKTMAFEYFLAAARCDNTDPVAIHNLTVSLVGSGRREDAIATLKASLESPDGHKLQDIAQTCIDIIRGLKENPSPLFNYLTPK
ncbi:MAG TPA: WcbI family polysaccharide biosynthesis putative acetyltransferase [Syntrophorhabdaceae bacterium]|nr:WcbI family polysaccharide biosynthesis putative acetyltransferase [Syntrophorhabdaceae bacterium]